MRRGVILLWLVCAGLRADDRPTFPPPPRLATTAEELKQRKPEQRDRDVRAAEALLKNPIDVPRGWGNWVFYYACSADASSLQALSADRHQCPTCKKIYDDERTVASYRTLQHDRANDVALVLAWGYASGGKAEHAREVRRILLRLADDYAGYPKRRDRWGREGLLAPLGGRRYSQSLDEAVGVIKLAKAYDLTRSSDVWTDKERRHVEDDFFRETSRTLLTWNQDKINHQTWYNAGLMCIASVLGDAELVKKVLTMRGGFRDQLTRSVGGEGLWYEGATAYHNYALQAMIEIVDAGRRIGLPLHEERAFRAMIEAPLRIAYPNGQFPAINDSDPGHLSSFSASFLWAWERYKDPMFAQAYADGDVKRLRELLGPKAELRSPASSKSENLPDAGLAILRRAGACVMLDHGQHGGGHGHFDKLNIVLFAAGREWLLDPGRLTYSHKEYKTWVKHTAAHNTVTLGGRSQRETTGKLLWFEDNPGHVACAASTDRAYPGAMLTRYLYLTDRMLIDVFDVVSDKDTQIDWLAHAVADSVKPVEDRGPGEATTPGKEDGYPHLTDARAWTVKGSSRWDYIAGKQHLHLWCDGPKEERFTTCHGIGYHLGMKTPTVLRRVQGKTARFVAVYDWTDDAPRIRSVRVLPGETPGVVVETEKATLRIVFTSRGSGQP